MELDLVTLIAAVAGPVALYFTRQGTINDRLNDRIDKTEG